MVDEDIKVEFHDIATAVNGNDNGEVEEAAATNTDSAHSDDKVELQQPDTPGKCCY